MAEYQEVIKQFWRICERYRTDVCCGTCPLKEVRGVYHCWRWISEEPEKAEELIMDWAEKNPVITNDLKFQEVFGCKPYSITLFDDDFIKWLSEEYKEPKDE